LVGDKKLGICERYDYNSIYDKEQLKLLSAIKMENNKRNKIGTTKQNIYTYLMLNKMYKTSINKTRFKTKYTEPY